jgi:hypothetical protein
LTLQYGVFQADGSDISTGYALGLYCDSPYATCVEPGFCTKCKISPLQLKVFQPSSKKYKCIIDAYLYTPLPETGRGIYTPDPINRQGLWYGFPCGFQKKSRVSNLNDYDDCILAKYLEEPDSSGFGYYVEDKTDFAGKYWMVPS